MFAFSTEQNEGPRPAAPARVFAFSRAPHTEFYIGIKTHAPFTANAFTIFNRWAKAEGRNAVACRAIARGQQIFNTPPIAITGVSGSTTRRRSASRQRSWSAA